MWVRLLFCVRYVQLEEVCGSDGGHRQCMTYREYLVARERG